MNLPGGGMPSPEYLNALRSSMPATPAMTADPRVAELPPAGPPPPPVVAAPPSPSAAMPFAAGPAPSTYFDQPPAAASPWSGPDPTASLAQGIAANAPPLQPSAPVVTQQQPAPAPAPEHRPFLQQIGGAGVVNRPAHETELRGPQLRAAQAEGHVATRQAIDEVSARNQEMAAADFQIANQQENQAIARQQAATNAAVTQQQEMQQRQADFDQSVKAMSAMSVDPGRFWAQQSTGQKLANIIALGIGGFTAGHNGGANPVQEQVNRMVDADIKAQEFAYHAAHDAANAKQSAFSMAMNKYQNEDQARAAARAASLDAVQAQVAKQAALWKGTAAQDRASLANAGLQDDKTKEIAQGVAYTPASQVAVAPTWVDPRTGLTYSEKEAKDVVKTMDANEFEREKIGLNTAGKVIEGQATAGAKADDKTDTETRAIAERLQTAGIPQARAAAERALTALNKSPGGTGESFARGALGNGALANKVLPANANAREQDYNAFKNAAMKSIFGNVTSSEEERANKQFGWSSDPESRKRAIAAMTGQLDAMERGIKAGASPAAQQEYNKRRLTAEGAPPLAPDGSGHGWDGDK